MSRVTVIDYGIGNLHSVLKALQHLGATVELTGSPQRVAAADHLVLPGVGAFSDGMKGLTTRGLVEPIARVCEAGRPFLGICLGMQMLLSESDEFGKHAGLGLIAGRVVAIDAQGMKVPHVGWNHIAPPAGGEWKHTALDGTAPGTMFYFVHSFVATPSDPKHRLAETPFGNQQLCAAVKRDNITGFQFHPEKSGPAGLALLSRFLSQ